MSSNLQARIINLRREINNERQRKIPLAQDFVTARQNRSFHELSPVKVKKNIHSKEGGPIQYVAFGKGFQLMTVAAGAKAPASMLMWDLNSGERTSLVEPVSNWILTAKVEQEHGKLVGCGGMSNDFTIYTLNQENPIVEIPTAKLDPHEAYVSDAFFLSQKEVVTASGDREIRHWNVQRQSIVGHFSSHTSDVLCLAKSPVQDNHFLSGAGDFTARLWDLRDGSRGTRAQATATFDTRSRDVSGVAFFPDGFSFATALSNSEVHVYDIRASAKLLTLCHSDVHNKVKCEQVLFSASGRLLFARYDKMKTLCFDLSRAETSLGQANVDGSIDNGGCVVTKFHGDRSKAGINAVHMAMEANGKVLALADSHETEVKVKILWPKEAKRR